MKINKKEPGWEHLFDVPGCLWEKQTDDLKAMHVTVPGNRHVVVYAYALPQEFNVVTYKENEYSDPSQDHTLWVGPMEAMCIILECLKEASSSTLPISSSDT